MPPQMAEGLDLSMEVGRRLEEIGAPSPLSISARSGYELGAGPFFSTWASISASLGHGTGSMTVSKIISSHYRLLIAKVHGSIAPKSQGSYRALETMSGSPISIVVCEPYPVFTNAIK